MEWARINGIYALFSGSTAATCLQESKYSVQRILWQLKYLSTQPPSWCVNSAKGDCKSVLISHYNFDETGTTPN